MTYLRELPELGVGVIYWPVLDELVHSDETLVNIIEVEPQPFWFPPATAGGPYQLDRQTFNHLRAMAQPKLVHGVGFPIGGTVEPEERQVAAFLETIDTLNAPWASEHLSFTRIRQNGEPVDMGFLLPPLQTPEGIKVAVRQIRALKERLPVPFIFETGVNYLAPRAGEMSDGSFFAAVAESADCGILLDLHNIWTNELNGRQRVADLLNELPLERVVEVHLAGGQEFDGYWVDAHSGLVPTTLMNLAEDVISRLPNLKAIVFEIMPQYVVANGISEKELREQFHKLHELWKMRGKLASNGPRRRTKPALCSSANELSSALLPTPASWERALGGVVTGLPSSMDGIDEFAEDHGTHVLRTLISAARAGRIADTLSLTTRLLLLVLGEERTQQLLEDFWRRTPSSQMTADEARAFVEHVLTSPRSASVPYLHEVTGFDLAAHQAVMTGRPQAVTFTVNPNILLETLRRGRAPGGLTRGNYLVTVAPPTAPKADHWTR